MSAYQPDADGHDFPGALPDFDSCFYDVLVGPESIDISGTPGPYSANAELTSHAFTDVTTDLDDQDDMHSVSAASRGQGSKVDRMPGHRSALREASESSALGTRQNSLTKHTSRSADGSSTKAESRFAVNQRRYRQGQKEELTLAEATHLELRRRMATALAFQSLWGGTIDDMSAIFWSADTVILSRAMLGPDPLIGPLAPDILQVTSSERSDSYGYQMSQLAIDPSRLDQHDHIPHQPINTGTSLEMARGMHTSTDYTNLFSNSPTPLSLARNPSVELPALQRFTRTAERLRPSADLPAHVRKKHNEERQKENNRNYRARQTYILEYLKADIQGLRGRLDTGLRGAEQWSAMMGGALDPVWRGSPATFGSLEATYTPLPEPVLPHQVWVTADGSSRTMLKDLEPGATSQLPSDTRHLTAPPDQTLESASPFARIGKY